MKVISSSPTNSLPLPGQWVLLVRLGIHWYSSALKVAASGIHSFSFFRSPPEDVHGMFVKTKREQQHHQLLQLSKNSHFLVPVSRLCIASWW